MFEKIFVIVLSISAVFFAAAQKKDSIPDLSKGKYVIANPKTDTVKLRDKASQTLRALKGGAVIVRLKTNEKSVEAYRKAGRNNIAEKIREERKTQNTKLYYAFVNEFKFCRVYFIFANQTASVLNGNYKVFLNKNLEVDSSIIFGDTTFVFCEYGSVESFSDFENVYSQRVLDSIPSQTSTSPSTYSGLVFLDKNLQQFYRPFPYVAGVYLDNFTPSVRTLNNELERAYFRLVVNRDFNEKIKAEKKKQKQQLKQLK
jgi:hypothetical protein